MTNDLMTIDSLFGGQAVSLLLLKSRKPSSRNSVAYAAEVQATWVIFGCSFGMSGKVWKL